MSELRRTPGEEESGAPILSVGRTVPLGIDSPVYELEDAPDAFGGGVPVVCWILRDWLEASVSQCSTTSLWHLRNLTTVSLVLEGSPRSGYDLRGDLCHWQA